jgi:hypothetical protein
LVTVGVLKDIVLLKPPKELKEQQHQFPAQEFHMSTKAVKITKVNLKIDIQNQ